MKRFECYREINIIVNLEMKIASVNIIHRILHELPKEVAIALFETSLYQMLIENNISIKECEIDATYNTNNLGFELYVMHIEFDGSEFPLAYLFLEYNGKCGDGIKTEIITKFILQLKEKELDSEFILIEAQIKQLGQKPKFSYAVNI
ncbi:hypothetical protein C1646_770721 [Rhizophagus diaphanus]|nr:hypothetical protein C1646_770721 [Rhizophagus diaphanus] [Rhizophagus sp. MUCL 43196]